MRRKKAVLNILIPAIIAIVIFLLITHEIINRQSPYFSAAVDEPLPAFEAPDLWQTNSYLASNDFKGKVILLNVWASWCPSCRSENPMLLEIQHSKIIPIYSLVYKDNAKDAKAFLSAKGNPFVKSGLDSAGTIAKQLQVYGTPETFLIDKRGHIRYRQVGTVDKQNWQEVLLPLVNQYNMEK